MITSPYFLASLQYYQRARHTSAVENFFSHTLLHYVPKRLKFFYSGYCVHNMLATLDHNRDVRRTALGVPIIKCQRSKRTKQWVAYKEIAAEDFSYITGMNFRQPLSSLTLLHTACTETLQKLFQSVSFHVTNTSVVYIRYVSVADSSWQPAEAKLNTGHKVNGSIYTIKNNSNSNMNKYKKFI